MINVCKVVLVGRSLEALDYIGLRLCLQWIDENFDLPQRRLALCNADIQPIQNSG